MLSRCDQLTSEIFNHPTWATDLRKMSGNSIAKIEHSVTRNFRICTDFSGTTLLMAIIRVAHSVQLQAQARSKEPPFPEKTYSIGMARANYKMLNLFRNLVLNKLHVYKSFSYP